MKLKKNLLNRSRTGNVVVYVVLTLMGAFLALPLLYTISSAFKPYEEIFRFPPQFFVRNPTLDNFQDLLNTAANSLVSFPRYLFNSLFFALVSTVLQIVFASLAAYPLAKHDFPGKNAMFGIVVTSLLFPTTVTVVPQYILMAKMHMINSPLALILPAIGSSMGLFLMKQFMESIPFSILEAARIDGANEPVILFKLVFPNAKPAWLTLAIFTFQSMWNSSATTLIFDESLKQLPTAINEIVAVNPTLRAGMGMAASLIMLIPPILFFIATQSNVVKTMAFAGIKE